MKLNLLGTLALMCFFTNPAVAETEWIYRTLMGNTLPPPKCATKPDATQNASKPDNVKNYAKRFCETQGYGWTLKDVKNEGKLVCEPCTGDKTAANFLCHVEDVVAECKRIKPGSVGMLPGKG